MFANSIVDARDHAAIAIAESRLDPIAQHQLDAWRMTAGSTRRSPSRRLRSETPTGSRSSTRRANSIDMERDASCLAELYKAASDAR